MRKKLFIVIILSLFIIIYIFTGQIQPSENDSSVEEKIKVVSEMWHYMKNYYPYYKAVEKNVEEKYLDVINSIINDNLSGYQYCAKLYTFGAALNDGHFSLIDSPYEVGEFLGRLPISIDFIDGAYYVVGKGKKAEVPLFSEIKSINGHSIYDYLNENLSEFNIYLNSPAKEKEYADMLQINYLGSQIDLGVLLPDGKETTVKMRYEIPYNKQFIYVDKAILLKRGEILHEEEDYSVTIINDLMYIDVNSFNNSNMIDTIKNLLNNGLKKSDKFIIDVRGNTGGNTVYAKRMLYLFTDQYIPEVSGKYKEINSYYVGLATYIQNSSSNALIEKFDNIYYVGLKMLNNEFYVRDETKYIIEDEFNGERKVVILSDSETVSAGENFLAYAEYLGIPIIGESSRGISGQVGIFELSDGTKFSMTTTEIETPLGEDIWNNGINPNIEICQTLNDLKNGIDTVLEYAIDYLGKNYD